FRQYEIDNPTAADVGPIGSAAVGQHGLVRAAGVLQRVGQDRHPVERPLVVDAAGQRQNVPREPRSLGRDRTERVAGDVAEQVGLGAGGGAVFRGGEIK